MANNSQKDKKEGFSLNDILNNQAVMIGLVIVLILIIIYIVLQMTGNQNMLPFSETSPGPLLTNTPRI